MQKVNRSQLPARTESAVVGGAQGRVAGAVAVAGRVDLLLGLLDPDAELERLGLERHVPAQQHAVGVAGAVADGQDGDVGRDVARAGHQPAEPAVGEIEVLDPAREADLAAQLLELPPEGADDERQPVRAEVGPVLVEDRRLAVAIGEDLEDPRRRPGPVFREVSLPSLKVPAPPSPKR